MPKQKLGVLNRKGIYMDSWVSVLVPRSSSRFYFSRLRMRGLTTWRPLHLLISSAYYDMDKIRSNLYPRGKVPFTMLLDEMPPVFVYSTN